MASRQIICIFSLFFALAVMGCSSIDSSSSSEGKKSNSKVDKSTDDLETPGDLADIDELEQKFFDDDNYEESFGKLIGKKVAVAGEVGSFLRMTQEPGVRVSVKSGSGALGGGTVNCYFETTDALQKCLPGQQVVIEGAICEKDYSMAPPLESCKILNVKGEPDIKQLTVADLDAGKEFGALDAGGVLSGKVKDVMLGTISGDQFFVDLETKQKKCVHFNLFKNLEADRIKNLKPGDSFRVYGSTTRMGTRKDYDGQIVLYDCIFMN